MTVEDIIKWMMSENFLRSKPCWQYPTKSRTFSKGLVYHCQNLPSRDFMNVNTEGWQQGAKLLVILKKRKARLQMFKISSAQFWKESLDRWNQVNPEWGEMKRIGKLKNSSWSKAYHIICQTCWRQCYTWVCIAAFGTGLLAFMNDDSSEMNPEVYRNILSA